MTLSDLCRLFAEVGCRKLYAKFLAANDNSKNQVYLAGTVEALNIFPSEQVFSGNTRKGPSFKARLNFGWLLESGMVAPAPWAQLILYSQYPEVRFSGFLRGCESPPTDLMNRRLEGRVLFLGVTGDRRVIGFVAAGGSRLASEFLGGGLEPTIGVFVELALPNVLTEEESRRRLLAELGRINRLGWIDSIQLDASGRIDRCKAPQCGGFTLEATLGIPKNSAAEPDFLGWEIKQHGVRSLDHPDSGSAITLMTPEPTGGYYRSAGVEAFVRKFGYFDRCGRADRMNFGGVHRFGSRQGLTGLTMHLRGYDGGRERITDATGGIILVSDAGEVAAEWAFAGLLAHWSRKHMHAVYVPSMRRLHPRWQYSFGSRIRLAQETSALVFLKALAAGKVYYDPGIKVERASGVPKTKRRSQFRIASRNIEALYKVVETVEV